MITLADFRLLLSQQIGDDLAGITTSTGDANKLTLVSLDLKAAALSDDAFNGQWVLITSGVCNKQERLISDFTQSTGTVFVDTAFSAQIASGVTFEIHRYQPSKKKNFINRALEMSYPFFVKKWDDKNLVCGNFLPNANFEDWTNADFPDYWTNVEANCTATKETTVKLFGNNAVKIIRTSGTGKALSIDQDDWSALLDLADSPVGFAIWARTAVASAARLQLYSEDKAGNSSTSWSAYHTGGNDWELLAIEDESVIKDAVIVSIRLNIETAATVYFDNAGLFGKAPYEYVLPLKLEVLTHVYQGNDWKEKHYYEQERLFGWEVYGKDGVNYLRFDKLPMSQRKMRIRGYGLFLALSADTDSVDLDAKRGNIIADGAASLLLRSLVGSVKSTDAQRIREEADKLESRFWALLERNQDVVSTLQTNIYTDSGED